MNIRPLDEIGLFILLSSQVPVLHEVRDITLARNGNVALVSYENKVRARGLIICDRIFILTGPSSTMENRICEGPH